MLKINVSNKIDVPPCIFIDMFAIQRIIVVAFVFLFSYPLKGEYEVRGKLNLSPGWQHQIFLATVNKLDDYYNANPEHIIQVGNISADGTFVLSGDNLPPERRFYRLYLVKEENTEFDACLYVGGNDHNFIHLILDNNSKIEIHSDETHFAPFGNYELIGDAANEALRQLGILIFPSFYFYQIKFPSKLQFSQEKLNRDLFEFSDTSQHILVALAALINTDMDKYFDLQSDKYLNFGKRLSAELNNHSYTDDYFRKMNYYSGELTAQSIPAWIFVLLFFLIIALLVAAAYILYLRKKIIAVDDTSQSTKKLPAFTRQEEKILSLILDEKSNKEIAAELFIELSTVKTHINKLYSKLGVKNRSEAKNIAKTLTDVGV